MKVIRYAIYAVIVLLLLAVAAVAIAVAVINPNDYKPQIEAAVEKQTNLDLMLEGDIGWSFIPLGLELNQVEANLDGFARLLRPGAEFRFATDQTEFAAWTLERMLRDRRFTWVARRADDWRLAPEGWVETRYEQKAQARGLKPVYLNFLRTDADSP